MRRSSQNVLPHQHHNSFLNNLPANGFCFYDVGEATRILRFPIVGSIPAGIGAGGIKNTGTPAVEYGYFHAADKGGVPAGAEAIVVPVVVRRKCVREIEE